MSSSSESSEKSGIEVYQSIAASPGSRGDLHSVGSVPAKKHTEACQRWWRLRYLGKMNGCTSSQVRGMSSLPATGTTPLGLELSVGSVLRLSLQASELNSVNHCCVGPRAEATWLPHRLSASSGRLCAVLHAPFITLPVCQMSQWSCSGAILMRHHVAHHVHVHREVLNLPGRTGALPGTSAEELRAAIQAERLAREAQATSPIGLAGLRQVFM